ncbi:hypothetical protein AB205_0087810 [Aquarana catesbeiana]|uniref:Uncharacterized protein n=1 Tax=Aquarana catesbeiana TaxID=8400 RepID=A0A2G9SKX5_AQUCT|nr:hypothetical protein AB205_0087810 [Aquarana catesbeiana]
MCDTLPKKLNIPVLRKGKNHVFSLEQCQNRQLYDTSKQCFIFLFLPSNICVLSIPFFYSHRGKKTRDIRGHQGPPASNRSHHTTTRGCGGRRDL